MKSLGSGIGGVIVAMILGESFPPVLYLLLTMLLGFVAYGFSINFYIMAQKDLGAAKTSAFYSVATFLEVGFSFLFLGEQLCPQARKYHPSPCGRNNNYDMQQLWNANEDIRSLKSLILFGIRGMAAYAYCSCPGLP